MLITPHSGSSQLLWNAPASWPIGVTCIWMPLRPSGSPMPGVGIAWPTVPGTGAALAGAGAAVVAAGVGAFAGVCAAAGVSPAAAKAIAHPISLIVTPVGVIGSGRRRF